MIPTTLIAVLIVLLIGIFILYRRENYGVCLECGPRYPYQLAVVNPFVYPYSGSSDLAYLAKEKNMIPAEPFPRVAPAFRPTAPLTNLTTPDHVLLFGYTGDGVY